MPFEMGETVLEYLAALGLQPDDIDLVDREGVQLVVFGHDGEQWQSLRKARDWYA